MRTIYQSGKVSQSRAKSVSQRRSQSVKGDEISDGDKSGEVRQRKSDSQRRKRTISQDEVCVLRSDTNRRGSLKLVFCKV